MKNIQSENITISKIFMLVVSSKRLNENSALPNSFSFASSANVGAILAAAFYQSEPIKDSKHE